MAVITTHERAVQREWREKLARVRNYGDYFVSIYIYIKYIYVQTKQTNQ